MLPKGGSHHLMLIISVFICLFLKLVEYFCHSNIILFHFTLDLYTDAPSPSWEELESVMLAVKLVVHGLVEFIQNFSKKSHDPPQVN